MAEGESGRQTATRNPQIRSGYRVPRPLLRSHCRLSSRPVLRPHSRLIPGTRSPHRDSQDRRRCDGNAAPLRDVRYVMTSRVQQLPPARGCVAPPPSTPLPLPGEAAVMSALAANPNNPVVFFDVTIGGQVGGGSCGPPRCPPSGSPSLGRANHEAAAALHALLPPCRSPSPWVPRRLRDFSRRGGGGWELRWGGRERGGAG